MASVVPFVVQTIIVFGPLSGGQINTEGAARMVREGESELGFIEGKIDDPALAHWPVGEDHMLLVSSTPAEAITSDWLRSAPWIMRETGSGTRSTFEEAIRDRGIDPQALNVVLTLPSNESVLAAVRAGVGSAVLSKLVVTPMLENRSLFALPFDLPARPFFGLRQKERYRSKAADALLVAIKSHDAQPDWVI